MKRLLATAAICTALTLPLAACSDDDDSPQDEATQAASDLCADLSDLKADTAALKNLDAGSTTKDQLEDATEQVQDDWDEVKDSLGDLASAKREALSGAVDDLKSTYDDLPGDTSVSSALSALRSQITEVQTTLDSASNDLKCP